MPVLLNFYIVFHLETFEVGFIIVLKKGFPKTNISCATMAQVSSPVHPGFGASEKGSKTCLLKNADCQHFVGKIGLLEGSGNHATMQSKTTTLQSKTIFRCFRPECTGVDLTGTQT